MVSRMSIANAPLHKGAALYTVRPCAPSKGGASGHGLVPGVTRPMTKLQYSGFGAVSGGDAIATLGSGSVGPHAGA